MNVNLGGTHDLGQFDPFVVRMGGQIAGAVVKRRDMRQMYKVGYVSRGSGPGQRQLFAGHLLMGVVVP